MPVHFSQRWRRVAPLVAVSMIVALLLAGAVRGATTAPVAPALAGGGVPVTLLAWFDFPKSDPRSAELSGIAWDGATRTLYAISDDTPKIVPLRPSADYRSWSFGDPIAVDIPVEWDGEGIALSDGGFFVSNEFGPAVFYVSGAGAWRSEVPVPAHFSRILRNRGFEALTLSPDGRYLFAANESPLEGDGPQPTADAGGLVRILRYDRNTLALVEYAYRTDPVFAPGEGGDRGLVDMAALSATDLLVMERSFVPNIGNNVRIYRVSLAGGSNVIDVENLSERTPVVSKTLLVDLASLPDADFLTLLQPQPNKILDNFEGMALGPVLADGRRILFVISDDNKRDTQIPRILVLAVTGL